MKVEEFEKAIDALKSNIILDEVKLRKGKVTRFFGHIGCKLVMWNENGEGYSTILKTVEPDEVTHNTHDGVVESCYDRDVMFDLRF